MTVIIKGMDMPDSCYFCRMRTDYGFCAAMPLEFCGYTDDVKRPDWCPLVEIPRGARLIDANKISSDMDDMKVEGEVFVTAVNYVKLIVNDAPVIFEEDEE